MWLLRVPGQRSALGKGQAGIWNVRPFDTQMVIFPGILLWYQVPTRPIKIFPIFKLRR